MESSQAFAGLYRDVVLAHGRDPRGAGDLDGAAHRATLENLQCGDRVSIGVRLDADGRIAELRHRTAACVICTASASLMADDVRGLDAGAVSARIGMLRSAIDGDAVAGLGDLAALTGVREHPSRHGCALLPWEALQAALAGTAPP